MDLVTTARIVRRRWYAALIGLVLTLAGLGVVATISPTYEATSVVVLLAPNTPPPDATAPGAGAEAVNPYRAFDSSITITAELMSTQLMQPEVVQALVRRGASRHYTVETDQVTGSPTVKITAKAPTPGQALATTRLVTDEFRRQLAARQTEAGAPASTQITASSVVTPVRADRLVSGRVKALVAVIGVGALFSVCCALVAEVIAVSRQRRRDRRELLQSATGSDPGSGSDGAEARSEDGDRAVKTGPSSKRG